MLDIFAWNMIEIINHLLKLLQYIILSSVNLPIT